MVSPLSTTFRVVRCSPSNIEPALSQDEMIVVPEGATESRITQYIRTREEELLRFLPDTVPTWFHFRRLPLAWMAQRLDAVLTRSSQRILALRAACHRIEGPDPIEVQPPREKGVYVATKDDLGVTLAPPEWIDELGARFGAEVVQEMGEVAINHSRLPRGARGPFGWWGGSVASPSVTF
jgi:hypothetical protein